MWFTEFDGNKIGRITTAGTITNEFTVPTANSGPVGIAPGPDNALWFTEYQGSKIARVSTAGVFAEFSLPTASSQPFGVVKGPDGAVWFTDQALGEIWRLAFAVGTHDFNGDGKSDILWRDTSGDVAVWLMNGSIVSQSGVSGAVQAASRSSASMTSTATARPTFCGATAAAMSRCGS